MFINRERRHGGPAFAALALAGLLTGPVQADVTDAAGSLAAPTAIVTEIPALGDLSTPTVPPIAPIVEEAPAPVAETAPKSPKIYAEGMASYYGAELAGNRTANGERFDPAGMTAAHRTLPMGTMIKVTNKANGKSVVVRINDRGPFVKKRIIDVSHGAAQRIAMVRSGTARVMLELIP